MAVGVDFRQEDRSLVVSEGADPVSRHAMSIVLSGDERVELERRVRARTSSQQAARRARIVLAAAEGRQNKDIATELGIARGTIRQWRSRFAKSGLAGLLDRPHCPPARLYGPEIQAKIVVLACQSPKLLGWEGQSHWSIRDLAIYIREHPELGLGSPSESTIATILKAHDVSLDRL
jgi:transposase